MTYKSKENYIISKAAGDIVLIPLTDSVVNMGGMLVLNETSVFILEHIKVATTITQLIDAFNKEYDCPDTQELTNDITSFLTLMIEKGYVEKLD